jgi:Bax protein
MSQIWYNTKIVLKTIMVISIVAFVGTMFYMYQSPERYVADAKEREVIITLPDFEHNSNQQFLDDVNQCVDYIYHTTSDVFPVNRELLLAQAALESGWGTSRFAREGHNLFGMRTYDLTEPHMLPSNNPKKWGVKVYMHECDSVLHYINTLNNGTNFEKYQKLKQEGENDPFKLLQTLDAYASDKHYFSKVKKIILLIREEYEINHIK